MDVSLDADGSIDRGSGFYGVCGALSASGVGQKENNGDRVRYRCRHRSRCLQRTVWSRTGSVLRSPAGNYQVILEKDEETGQLMLNRPYKGLFRYQKELLPLQQTAR